MTAAHLAVAAPFCVERQGIAPECYYIDSDQCRKRAGEISGRCTVNAEEVDFPAAYGNYCMVASGGIVQCIYVGFDDCDREAKLNKGVCTLNPERQGPPEQFQSEVDGLY